MEINGAQAVPVADADVATLAELARLGDEHAFTLLHERYERDIFNFLYRQSNNEELAKDLTQDTFLKAWLGIMQTAPDLKFVAWLYRIASNRYLDHCRHVRLVTMQRWDTFFDAHGNQLLLVNGNPSGMVQGYRRGALTLTASELDQPEAAALDAELQAQVRAILATLPAKYALVLTLREYGQCSYDEIAAHLDTTRASVKSLLFRAREQLCAEWTRREAAAEAVLG